MSQRDDKEKKLERYAGLLSGIKAVLFDFDGILVDSEEYYFRSSQKGFNLYGHKLNRSEYWEWWTLKGVGIDGESRRHKLGLTPEDKKTIMDKRIRAYREYIRKGRIRFIPETYAAIALFRRAGKKTVIASNSLPEEIGCIFKTNRKPIDLPVVGRMNGLRTKPHPDVFLYAAGLVRTEPCHCLVIEDAHKGLAAARECGMRCVIIRNRISRRTAFPEADLVFDSPREFLSLTAAALGRMRVRG